MASIQLPNILPYQPIRISVERYRELVQAGAFQEHDNVELLDGVVVEKMSKNPPHRIATRRCDLSLSRLVPAGWHVQNQEPITLATSEPEPDVAIVRGRLEDYTHRHPCAEEIALVVEVADTSLVTDRFKASVYADARIPVYWIVNLNEQVIEVMQNPIPRINPSQYASTRIYSADEKVPVLIDGVLVAEITAMELLSSI